MYYRGHGAPADHEQAARWFRAAAEQGIPEAQNLLAVMYYKGDGVAVDHSQAAEWARRAAEQGYAPAQADLAYMFEQGNGVPLDYVTAYTWYSVAAAAGEVPSSERLKSLTRVMLAEQMRVAKARAVAWQAQHRKAESQAQVPVAMSFLPDK
jgi:TPR repeat protein